MPKKDYFVPSNQFFCSIRDPFGQGEHVNYVSSAKKYGWPLFCKAKKKNSIDKWKNSAKQLLFLSYKINSYKKKLK